MKEEDPYYRLVLFHQNLLDDMFQLNSYYVHELTKAQASNNEKRVKALKRILKQLPNISREYKEATFYWKKRGENYLNNINDDLLLKNE